MRSLEYLDQESLDSLLMQGKHFTTSFPGPSHRGKPGKRQIRARLVFTLFENYTQLVLIDNVELHLTPVLRSLALICCQTTTESSMGHGSIPGLTSQTDLRPNTSL